MSYIKAGGSITFPILLAIFCILWVFQTPSFGQSEPGNLQNNPEKLHHIKLERIKALITAINSDDPDRVRDFFKKHCTESLMNSAPMNKHLEFFKRIHQSTGEMDFRKINVGLLSDIQATVISKSRSGREWKIDLSFAEKQNYLISGISFDIIPVSP